jgi:hypothetical protein
MQDITKNRENKQEEEGGGKCRHRKKKEEFKYDNLLTYNPGQEKSKTSFSRVYARLRITIIINKQASKQASYSSPMENTWYILHAYRQNHNQPAYSSPKIVL